MNRRDFLGALAGGLATASLPAFGAGYARAPVPASFADFWQRPRELWLRVARTGEEARPVYALPDRLLAEGYVHCCRLLRDVRRDAAVQMDVRLLDLLRAVQGWLTAWGHAQPIVILSGYRTQATNDEVSGARASQHLLGRAADFVIPGLPPDYLGQLAQAFRAGGVGFYTGRFTHIDTGAVRTWRG